MKFKKRKHTHNHTYDLRQNINKWRERDKDDQKELLLLLLLEREKRNKYEKTKEIWNNLTVILTAATIGCNVTWEYCYWLFTCSLQHPTRMMYSIGFCCFVFSLLAFQFGFKIVLFLFVVVFFHWVNPLDFYD